MKKWDSFRYLTSVFFFVVFVSLLVFCFVIYWGKKIYIYYSWILGACTIFSSLIGTCFQQLWSWDEWYWWIIYCCSQQKRLTYNLSMVITGLSLSHSSKAYRGLVNFNRGNICQLQIEDCQTDKSNLFSKCLVVFLHSFYSCCTKKWTETFAANPPGWRFFSNSHTVLLTLLLFLSFVPELLIKTSTRKIYTVRWVGQHSESGLVWDIFDRWMSSSQIKKPM